MIGGFPFHGQEAIRGYAGRGVMVKAAPATALVMVEPEFVLELLVVPLDPPPELHGSHEGRERRLGRHRGEPVLRRLVLARRPFDQEPMALRHDCQPAHLRIPASGRTGLVGSRHTVYYLGFNCFGQNAAAALVSAGQILGAVEEERLTRIKDSGAFPERSIRCLLDRFGIGFADIAKVDYYWQPYLDLLPAGLRVLRYLPESLNLVRGASYNEEYAARLRKMLTIRGRLADTFDPVRRFSYLRHHACHAASAFYPSPFDSAAVLTVDMFGEWTSTEFWDADSSGVRSLRRIAFPHSLGMIYAAFTSMLGFAPLGDEWKVMGLSPYGKPRYRDFFTRLIRLTGGGSFEVDTSLVAYHVRG